MATVVVCHGAWSAAWAWKKVRPLLRAAGHDVYTPTYTGLGERAHHVSRSINLETHIADVLAVLDCEDLRDVVLVGHSYGGMVATFDLQPAPERAKRQEAARAEGDGWLMPPNPSPPDTSPEDLAWITPRRRWQPIGTFAQPLRLLNGPLQLPRAYIYCTRLGPGDIFGQFARRYRDDAGWKVVDIDASHSPNVTAPDSLARLLDQLAR
jgi:hypothetical protein